MSSEPEKIIKIPRKNDKNQTKKQEKIYLLIYNLNFFSPHFLLDVQCISLFSNQLKMINNRLI